MRRRGQLDREKEKKKGKRRGNNDMIVRSEKKNVLIDILFYLLYPLCYSLNVVNRYQVFFLSEL